MKRTILPVLLLIICVLICACRSNNDKLPDNTLTAALTANPKDNELLPFNLEFGMSQEKAKEVYTNFPTVRYSDYESFYQIDWQTLYNDMVEGKGMVLDPSCSFDFNDNQELYCFTVKSRIYDNERPAEYLFDKYVDFFQTKSGCTAIKNETSKKLEANIETETLRMSVILEETGGDCTVSAITCCKVYE